MAKNKFPTLQEVEALKSDFTSELNTINKEEKKGKTSPKKAFLSSISEEIKTSLENGTTYQGIKSAIKKIYSIDVSTQIIANFAHNELQIPKRKKTTKTAITDNKKSSLEIKEEMAKNEPKEEATL